MVCLCQKECRSSGTPPLARMRGRCAKSIGDHQPDKTWIETRQDAPNRYIDYEISLCDAGCSPGISYRERAHLCSATAVAIVSLKPGYSLVRKKERSIEVVCLRRRDGEAIVAARGAPKRQSELELSAESVGRKAITTVAALCLHVISSPVHRRAR